MSVKEYLMLPAYLRTRIWFQTVLFFCMACLANVHATAPIDLTGHYERPPVKSCKPSDVENTHGPAYNHNCFSGDAYGYSPVLRLVQNGKMICGSYSECGGTNCSKVYSGEVAGMIQNNTISLFWTNGHFGEGPAETLNFRVVHGGLVDASSKSNEPNLVKRSSKLKTPQVFKSCTPQFPKQILIDLNFGLNVKGILREDQVSFVNLTEKKYASSPKVKRLLLTNQKSQIQWTDVRTTANFVIRPLTLVNTSNKPWTVQPEHPEACREFLASGYNTRKDLVHFSGFEKNELRPGESVALASCDGTIWQLEKTLPTCPKFQCLEGCKC